MVEAEKQPEMQGAHGGKGSPPSLRSPKAEPQRPKTETVHVNIGFANTYRLELAKTMLAISAALFAFTISFPPALTQIDQIDILAWAWAGLGMSIIGGLLNLYGWEKFYISYRDYHYKYPVGQRYRKWVTRARRLAHLAQMLGMLLGIVALAWFVIINRSNVKLAETKEVASSSASANASIPITQGK